MSAYLLTSVCIPILMYSLEATAPNRTIFNSLDGAVNNAVRNIFNVTDQANVKCIRLEMNIKSIESVCKSLMMDFVRVSTLKNLYFSAFISKLVYVELLPVLRDLNVDCILNCAEQLLVAKHRCVDADFLALL